MFCSFYTECCLIRFDQSEKHNSKIESSASSATIDGMRLVVQRVNKAKVEAEGSVSGKIKKGLFVLVGVAGGDTEEDANILSEKLTKLRILADYSGKMNLSVMDKKEAVLVVSQFTLHADTRKGNRPSFIKAAKEELAKAVYARFVDSLREKSVDVQTGKFGEYMNIEAELDGPVTIILDSNDF